MTSTTAVAGRAWRAGPLADDELAFLRAVLYSSLFDYPLTLPQARETLIGSRDTEAGLLAMYYSSPALQTLIDYRDGLFFVRGADHLVEERRRREQARRALLETNRGLLKLICAVPFTALVALSGSAAHLNARPAGGDLDLFIVTRGRHVWSVTLTILLLARLLRRRDEVRVNFVVADSALPLDAGQQDLCCANGIVHLRPLIGGSVYCRFVDANPFVERYYPNFEANAVTLEGFAPSARAAAAKHALESLLGWGPSALAERLCRVIYLRHLRRRAASRPSPADVRLTPDCLELHTCSHSASVLARYEQTVQRTLGILNADC